jgi:hypothetical protein
MAVRDQQSYIFQGGANKQGAVSPNTRVIHSTKTRVYSYDPNEGTKTTQIGVISTFNPTHSRAAEAVRGIGFGDQIAELVPAVSEPITISVDRAALYMSNVMQAFGYNGGIDGLVRSLKHHKWPFDVKQEIAFSELTDNGGSSAARSAFNALITWFEACWLTDYNYSVTSDGAVVTESATVSVTDIHDGVSRLFEGTDTGNAFKSKRLYL